MNQLMAVLTVDLGSGTPSDLYVMGASLGVFFALVFIIALCDAPRVRQRRR